MEPLTVLLVRLSFRRSRSVFSPLRACCLARFGDELDDDALDSGFAFELPTLAVSVAWGVVPFGDSVRCDTGFGIASSCCQFAGVGGTGPRAITPLGGGRRVGGDIIGSLPDDSRWAL